MNKILNILEKEILFAEMKQNRSRNMGLDYEMEYWTGQLDALEYIRDKIVLFSKVSNSGDIFVPSVPDDEIFNPYDKSGY